MGVSEILAELDREIAQLQQARVLLGGNTRTRSEEECREAEEGCGQTNRQTD